MMSKRIIRGLRTRREKCSGFTLIEALIAIALMGVVLAAITSITSQWLPSWNRGIARAQRSDLVRIALDRLVADLGASEFVTPNRETKTPLFDGTEFSVTFIRTAVGPNARPGLEIVRIAEIPNKGEPVLVRATKQFTPLASNTTVIPDSDFTNPTVVLRSPYLVSFAYAGRDRIWKSTWQNVDQLPAAVRLTVRDATSGRTLTISTTALVHVELPAACAGPKSKDDCGSGDGQPNNPPTQAGSDKQRT